MKTVPASILMLGMALAGPIQAQQQYTTDGNTMLLYHLNETSGTTAADSSGNGRTATVGPASGILGHASASAALGTAIAPKDAQFPDGQVSWQDTGQGANSFLNPANTANFTVEGWVKLDLAPTTTQALFAVQGYQVLPDFEIDLRGERSGKEIFLTSSDGTTTALSQSLTWTADQWYHIAVVCEQNGAASTYTFYRTPAGTTTAVNVGTSTNKLAIVPHVTTTDRVFNIGNIYGNSGHSYFQGAMDEVRFSNVARSAGDFAETLHVVPESTSITLILFTLGGLLLKRKRMIRC